jgi:hypothetical protein
MSQRTAYFPTVGGLDLVTPPIQRPPGHVIGGKNYLPRPEGYRRTPGFERYDGRPEPSAASYAVLNFDAGTATIAEGATVTGATSGATGKALIAAVVESGSYGASTAAGYLVLTTVTGAFQDNEALQVSGVTKCTADGTATDRGADNDADDSTWLLDAVATARALIGVVPGSGAIRGVWRYNGVLYAFRDNAGATAGVMHKESAAGWTAVGLGRSVAFTSGGTYVIAEGNTITGATSGATAVITRVVLTSGSWSGGDAAGRLIFASQTGTFQAENLDVAANLNVATIAGNSAAITLPAGGRYECVTYNFTGMSGNARMYGANGVGSAFEFDGTVFVPLLTGMTTDTPTHLAAHLNYLFLSFPGGSVQFSGLGDPYAWDVILGAGEFGIGQEVTGFVADYAGVLVVLGRNKVGVLYGSVFSGTGADGVLKIVSSEAGAAEWSVQPMSQPVFVDDRGVRTLSAVQEFGDFSAGSLSRLIKPLLDAKRRDGLSITASLRVRDQNQYRVWWSDGSGLVLGLEEQPAFMPLDYDGKVVRCAASVEDDDGNEMLFFGSDDGYVYRLDVGTSSDGEEIDAYLRFAFNNMRSPTQNKRFHKATLEINTDGPTAALRVTAECSYGNPDLPSVLGQDFTVAGSGGGIWNESNWNAVYWSSQVHGQAEAHLDGIGTSISLAVASRSAAEKPHVIHGVTLHYSPRGLAR